MNGATEPAANERIPALDGLRGLAVLAVIAVHANVLYGGETVAGGAGAVVARLLGAGWIGVDLFFCLSGFLITRILWQARRSPHYFRDFYARRLLRILPLYYAFVVVVFLGVYRLAPPTHSLSGGDVLSVLFYTNNLHYAATGVAVPHLGHFWSLAVEEHFYLLWPLAVRLLPRRRLMQLCLTGAALALALRLALVAGDAWPFSAYLLTPCRLDGLLFGSLLALAAQDAADLRHLRWALRSAALPAVASLAAIVIWNGEFSARPHGADLRLTVTAGIAGIAVLLAGALARAVYGGGRWGRLLQTPWLRTVGRYSYAMYVCHCLVVSGLKLLLETRLRTLAALPAAAGKLLTVVVVALLSLAAGWASYHLWEKHFLKLQRHFTYTGSRHESVVRTAASAVPRLAEQRFPELPKELVKC
jgi:peptidoglycan/LPS O-acetylase OafA/YrhL